MVSPITATTALNLNQEMTDFNYKKYSLENLENWLHDAMSTGEATPQEIYDVIRGVVEENYYTYKHQTSQAYELLALLNGNGKNHISSNLSDDWRASPWTQTFPSPNKDDVIVFNTKEEVKSCGVGDTSEYCKNSWNDFWEQNYYPEEYITHVTEDGDIYPIRDKVVKWQLPVQLDGLTGDCYINLPDDLLERAGLKEGDTVEWIDRNDGSFELRKVNGTK